MDSICYGLGTLALMLATQVMADGSTIDKIYHPYVQLLEKEWEYRLTHERDDDDSVDGRMVHKLGYGQSLSDQWFVEAYVIAEDAALGGTDISGIEMEAKWQLTEQGEYGNDYGLLFELEREFNRDAWELGATFIAVHEWTNWIGTANVSVFYESGDDVNDEFETSLATQLKYRLRPTLEPALEFYQGQDTSGLGPVLSGLWRGAQGRKLLWEAGAIAGLDSDTPDVTWKVNLEWEF